MARLARIVDRPRWGLALCAALSLLAIPALFRVGFEEDLTQLFPEDFAEVAALQEWRDTFGGTDSLLLLLRAPPGRRDELLAAGDALAEALRRRVPEGATVHHRLDEATRRFFAEVFRDHAFAWLAPDELAAAQARLTPAGVREAVAHEVQRLEATADPAAEERFREDPVGLGADVFLPALRRSSGRLIDLASQATLAPDGRALLLRVEGTRHAQDVAYSKAVVAAAAAAVDDMRAARAAAGDATEIQVTRAGGYRAAVVNERHIKADLITTTLTSVVGVLLLFAVAFPPRLRGEGGARGVLARLAAPHVLVVVPLLLGVLWTAGLTGWAVGQITSITAGFIAVLVGLGVDFPIHLLARYRDARATHDPVGSIRVALGAVGPGLVAAALTTAGGFAVLLGSRFPALAELGGLTAAGLLFCLVAVFATAPVFYPRVALADRAPLRDTIARLGRLSPGAAWGVLAVAALATGGAVAGLASRGLRFEEDLRRLAIPDPEATTTQHAVAAAFGLSPEPMLLLTRAPDAAAAAEAAARVGEGLAALQRAGDVAALMGPASFCPSRARVAAAAAALADVDPAAVRAATEAALREHGFDPHDFATAIDRLDRALTGSRRGDLSPARLEGEPDVWRRVVRATDQGGVAVTLVQPTAGADRHALADAVAAVVAGTDSGTVIASMDRIVARLRAELTPEMRTLGGLAALAVALVVWAHFRHPGWSLTALLPVTLGLVWTAGVMAWCDIPLTFFNVCAFPLLLGIGVDDGIHIVARHREPDRPDPRATIGAVGIPVVLTSATTMLGFGTLTLASSPGLASLGQVAAIGVAACLVASLGPCTAVLALSARGRGPPKTAS